MISLTCGVRLIPLNKIQYMNRQNDQKKRKLYKAKGRAHVRDYGRIFLQIL